MPSSPTTPRIQDGGLQPATAASLRAVREACGLSLRDLEERTGITRADWSRIENGKLLAEPRHLQALADTLGVPMRAFRFRFVLEIVKERES